MRKVRALVLCCLLAGLAACSACTVWKEKPVNSWSGATGAEHFERLMWQDVKARHWQQVETHLAPGFVFVYPGGTRDRSATMDYLKSLSLTDYTLGDFSTTSHGADMIVTYTARLTATQQGQPLPSGPMHMMTVWQQVTKNWIAIAHSETPASGQ